MLLTMQHTMIILHAQSQAPPPPRDRLGDFQRTKPPIFSRAVELMDANDWLQSIEKKLQVVQCNKREKVLLASGQLFGPVADWWDAYVRNLRASTGRSSEALSVHIIFPRSYQDKEGVLGSETGVHVYE
jgi:hypothetical protein